MTRKESDARYRDKIRQKAKVQGLSVKAYKASRWQSVGWAYAVETIRKRCRKNGVSCTIKPVDLQSMWKQQDGICLITGWQMELRKTGSGLTPKTVTVDRKNPTKGYDLGNIRLISFAANNAKYVWSDRDLKTFCKAVVNNVS